MTITDTEGRPTNFTYASPVDSDFISKITDSASRIYQYGYDANRNLTTYTDANNKITRYQYNANNQMSQIQDPRGKHGQLHVQHHLSAAANPDLLCQHGLPGGRLQHELRIQLRSRPVHE